MIINKEILTKMDNTTPPDMFGDCLEFTKLYNEKTGGHFKGRIDRKFIIEMVNDELSELAVANDEAEEVDALLDAVYYILNHIASAGIDARPVWNLIHKANMTKFGPGGYKNEIGKWCKPPDFKHPDDDIREEIARQRELKAAGFSGSSIEAERSGDAVGTSESEFGDVGGTGEAGSGDVVGTGEAESGDAVGAGWRPVMFSQ